MADNTTLNAGAAGDVVRTNDRAAVKTPVVMLDLGSDSAESILDGTAAIPAALVPVSGGIVKRLTQTPTVTAGAYSANDAVGGLLTFSNAARASGGSIVIDAITIVDKSQQDPTLELLLFDQTFTNVADNAAFDPTDADLANVIGIIPFTVWYDFADNSVTTRAGLGLSCKLAGTDLFGQLVTRTAPTLSATSDIIVILHVTQN